MTDENGPNQMVSDIRGVWGEYDDFEEGGFNYAAFVILQDLREMEEEEWDHQTCVREMTDVVINALRALDELSTASPEAAVRYRLNSHQRKKPPAIIERYQHKFERRL